MRWRGTIPAGKVNETTVVAGIDLLPSLCALAGVKLPEGYTPDGLDLNAALLGRPAPPRLKPIIWEYGRHAGCRPFLKKDAHVWDWFAANRSWWTVFNLPPYSPEFNATERLWHHTRIACD